MTGTLNRGQLPVLEVQPPEPSGRLGVRGDAGRGALPADPRLDEFRTEDAVLPRFLVWTLGCQMNRSDSEEMVGRLLSAGCSEAPSLEETDLLVINSCAIREGAEQKIVGRQGQLERLKAANPALRVVLTGCSVREPDRAKLGRRYPAVDLFLRPDEEPELVARLGIASTQGVVGSAATAMVGRATVGAADHLAAARASALAGDSVSRSSTISAWLPIVYGCDKSCTYCIVPFSRGPERSRPFDEIVAEAEALAMAGYREVTLLGQNVNSYGHDLPVEPRFAEVTSARTVGRRQERDGRPDLAALLDAVDRIGAASGDGVLGRIRFVTSHPWDLSDRLIDAMASCRGVCEHLHLPVQSGDDGVLRRMGRQYTIAHYLERLAAIRAAVPGIAISTDVIVGFPGETEFDFEGTLELLETVRYDQVFAAAFSPRPGTPAARLVDDVPAGEKRRRLNALLARQERIGFERNQALLGASVEVLVDSIRAPRSHDHAEDDLLPAGAVRSDPPDERDLHPHPAAELAGEGSGRIASLSGRTRTNKLVHFDASPGLLGQLVRVRIDHAGPYALRGSRT